jgi:non-heme chloroperoxidase
MKYFLSALLLVPSFGAVAAAEPAAGLVKVATGITLNYVVQGRAGGETIVLVHGVGDSWHSWEPVLPLIPERYQVYAVSMRGHGLSDAPPTGYTQRDLAADIGGFLEAMKLTRVTLVGHSLGSFVAQRVAIDYGDRVKALVLEGSGPGGASDPAVIPEVRAAFEGMRDNPRLARDFQGGMTTRPIPASFFEKMVDAAASVPGHVWTHVAEAVQDEATASKLSAIKVPTLIIWGDQDVLLKKKDQDALLARIPSSRLITYPGVGHCPHWEEPTRFAADLIAFTGSSGR